MDFDSNGWALRVRLGSKIVAHATERWSDSQYAPITDELSKDTYLWGQLGNWSNGRGTGSLTTRLRTD